VPSSIKKNSEYIYIRIRFDSHFANKNNVDSTIAYPVKSREAMVRLDSIGKGNGMPQ